MIQRLIRQLQKKRLKAHMSQEELTVFVLDKKTIDKAAQGSMKKRNDLLERVELLKKHA